MRDAQLGVDECGLVKRDGDEGILVREGAGGVGVGEGAGRGDGEVEDGVGDVEIQVRGGVEGQDAGGVERADGEGLGGRGRAVRAQHVAAPVVPGEVDGARRGAPQVRGHVDFQVVRRRVEEGRDNHVLVDVPRDVVQVLPPARVLDAGPRRRLPDVLQLPVQRAEVALRHAAAAPVELDLAAIEVGLEDLRALAPGGEVGGRVLLVRRWVVLLDRDRHLAHPFGAVGEVGRVEAARGVVVIAELDRRGVEV